MSATAHLFLCKCGAIYEIRHQIFGEHFVTLDMVWWSEP